MQMKSHQVPIGARLIFRGREYVKLGLSMAEDEKRDAHVFQYEAEVESDKKVDASNSGMAGEWIKRGPSKQFLASSPY
jgi:hypothetical protein